MRREKTRRLATILACSMLFAAWALPLQARPVHAITDEETRENLVLVVGAALSEVEISQTADALGVPDDSNIVIHKVTGEDIAKYINVQNVQDSQMISSVLVEFRDEGGIETHIATPDRITSVKSYQYSNAAITAGIYDSKITVAAVEPVTGESALTGIYKAAEVYGMELDQERLIAGNDELETVQDIEENNEDNEAFDSEKFSQALTEIKVQIANQVDNSSRTEVNIGDITTTIQNVLNQYNINLPETDVNQLAETIVKYKDTLSDEHLDQVKEQLQEFGEKTWNMAKEAFENAQESGLLDKIAAFFRDLFNAIRDLFR